MKNKKNKDKIVFEEKERLRAYSSDLFIKKEEVCIKAETKLLEMKKKGLSNFETLEVLDLILDAMGIQND